MRQTAALLGLVIALGIAYFIYREQMAPERGTSPVQQQIETAGLTADLVAAGQAERLYLASHGSYATLDQLQADGGITFSSANRRGYTFTAELDDGQHFRITARPTGQSTEGDALGPTFSIDETLQVTRQ